MDKPAKVLAAVVLLAAGGLVLAWQGQLAWTRRIDPSGQPQDASATAGGTAFTANGYLRSGGVPGQALYGWSYPFAFPHDTLAAVQKPNEGRAR